MRSVWSRVGSGSTTRGLALGQQPREQQAGLDLGAGDRHLVGRCRAAARPRSRAAAAAPRGQRDSAPIWRSGSAIRSTGRRRIESSPSSVHSPLPAPRASPAAAAAACRRCRRRSPPGAAPRSPTPRDPQLAPAPSRRRPRPGAERLDGGQGRAGVGGVEVALDRVSPSPIAAISAARWEIDLSAGGRRRRAAARGIEAGHRRGYYSAAEDGDGVAEAADQARGPRGLLVAGDPEGDRAGGHVRGRVAAPCPRC